jgi:hypothetical protein
MSDRTEKKRVEAAQPFGKEHIAWGLFNWGCPWGTFRTRRDAIVQCGLITGKDWAENRKSCRVQKVRVTPL